ncbi:MAG TPA: lysozyme [Ruminococcaceae bacterium]|nr:lysozyme [Oscillospiraceae bacterium]
MKHSQTPAPSGGKRIGVIIAVIVLSAALIIGVGYGAMRILNPKSADDPTSATAAGEVVTINDSVMGDIELKTVKGAEVNTYTADNLVTDENGVPSYYENGKKISHLGVDLSEFQGDVDFAAMKEAGVEFVMLRIGGRYYGDDGVLYTDNKFDTNYEKAKAAGLKVGAYFFSQAISAEDAKQEANYALEKLNKRQLDYPIALDWENIAEEEARTDKVMGDQLTDIAETFCDTIEAAGYKSIVYSNTQQMFIMYDFETMKDYDFWLADYREFPTMYYKFDMWQYTMTGSIAGVEGTVDMNISFTDFAD